MKGSEGLGRWTALYAQPDELDDRTENRSRPARRRTPPTVNRPASPPDPLQHWRVDSVSAAVLGFAGVACVWWLYLYFDHQSSVALRGSTMSIVAYSYAHIPLLMGLAAMGAGVRMLIDRAGQAHLGPVPAWRSSGASLFLVSLIGRRVVRSWRALSLWSEC